MENDKANWLANRAKFLGKLLAKRENLFLKSELHGKRSKKREFRRLLGKDTETKVKYSVTTLATILSVIVTVYLI